MKNIKRIILVFMVLFTVFFTFSSTYNADNLNNESKTSELETYEPFTDNKGTLTGNDILGSKNDSGSVMYILSEVYNIARIIAVIMVIVLSMMDFTKVIASSDSGITKKTFNNFTKRLVILMALFLIPSFIKLIFDFVFGNGTMCSI